MINDGKILKASIEDSIGIAALIKAGWNSAYKGLIPDNYLKNMNEEEMAKRWQEHIENNKKIYVYKINNELMGVIRFGKYEDTTSEDIGEIMVLYVEPDNKRKGIGTKLFMHAKQELIKEGYKKMIIWCLKGNVQGANFYKKMQGQNIGERDYEIRGLKIREEGFFYNLI